VTTPSGVLALVGGVLAIVAFVRRPARPPRVVEQFGLAMLSWGALWFAGASAFAREGMTSLPIHMIGHVIVMFLVPMGLIGSASARSTWWVWSIRTRRRVLRWWYVERRWRAPGWLAHPITAAIVLNVVMVSAHTPRVFDAIMNHAWAMDWIMEPAFLLSGLFFFHFLISAPPRRNHVRLRLQFAMIVVTMFEMLVLAMAMSIFTKTSWYSVMDPIPGMANMPGMGMHATTLAQAFHNQQLAAAILWVCGDFWAVPCLVVITRRVMMRDGSLFGALERQSAKFSGSSV
jgi:cytochrome c oxidase assembly factor CtaG